METALLLIAAIKGIFQGVQTWIQYRDRARTLEALRQGYNEGLNSSESRTSAEYILGIVPESVVESLRARVQRCYDMFERMLQNESEFFEEQITDAAKLALPACVCRNLGMIVDVTGGLPDEDLQEAWETYKCKVRLKESPFS